jgi:hypothetical protein
MNAMNEFSRFEQLAAQARAERVPPIDVTVPVLRNIRSAVAEHSINGPLAVVSGFSLLAASIMAAVAAQMWSELVDPLSVLFDSLMMVMQ